MLNKEAGNLISYFPTRDEAREAFRQLKKNGFLRAALVQKTADGKVRKWDPFIWRRIIGMTLGAVLFGGFTGIAAMVFPGTQLPTVGTLSGMTSILIGALIGFGLAAWAISMSLFTATMDCPCNRMETGGGFYPNPQQMQHPAV